MPNSLNMPKSFISFTVAFYLKTFEYASDIFISDFIKLYALNELTIPSACLPYPFSRRRPVLFQFSYCSSNARF